MEHPATVWLAEPTSIDNPRAYQVSSGWLLKNEDGSHDYNGASDMTTHGWYEVARVTIHIDPPSPEEVVPSAIRALRAKQTANRVRAEEENQQIEKVIANLLSLTYEEASSRDEPFDNPHHGHKGDYDDIPRY